MTTAARAFVGAAIFDGVRLQPGKALLVRDAIRAGVPGIEGLHLEGPHLALSRKGAHDPDLICPMEDADLDLLLDAARRLPVLKVTVAPEAVSPRQMHRLSEAGILLSLGHSDAPHADCVAAFRAGAR